MEVAWFDAEERPAAAASVGQDAGGDYGLIAGAR